MYVHVLGELESAAALSQGASATLQSRFRDLSDPFEIFVCKECRAFADGNKATNYAWCNLCASRKSVYLVKVPFTFHLNMCELAAIGVKTCLDIEPSLNLLVGSSVASCNDRDPNKNAEKRHAEVGMSKSERKRAKLQ